MAQAISTTTWQGQDFIDGRWRGVSGEYLENMNPARFEEVLGLYPRGTAADVDRAVAAARRAFPAWRRTSRIKRGELFFRLAELVRRDTDALAAVLARESGKVLNEARAEVVEGLHMIQYVFGTARQPIGDVLASEIEAKDVYVRRKPRGVVAVITPWNFPFAVPLWMLGPSLLEGNTTVFKPSEETPEIGQRLVGCSRRRAFPPARSTWCTGWARKWATRWRGTPTSTSSASPAATRSARTSASWRPRAITKRAPARWAPRAP